MRIYRLCKEPYSTSVLSGDGGLHADGRWHTQGQPIIYCASSEALAVLELRVHIGAFLPRALYVMHEIEVTETIIEHLDASLLPDGWDAVPHSDVSQHIGDAWLEERRSAALRVPSLHSRTEFNVLVNPQHKACASIAVQKTWTYQFDPRLFAL